MQLNGDLCSDVIGTNPTYPPIVDHSWLSVDLSKYDNYPSDNNPLRIVPKLSELWNHSTQAGVSLVPNTQVMPLGIRSSEEDGQAVDQIVKEAKKAVMSGLTGKKLSGHLRARFSSKHLGMAQEALKKVAEEVGLLGNVYIDASAFTSFNEAEQFLSQHRSRLARDILINVEGVHPSHVSALASTFHKNIVSSINYDENTLKKYKDHLVQAKRIPEDMVIASKEDLRKAFLYVAPISQPVVASKPEAKEIEASVVKEVMEKNSNDQAIKSAEEKDSILMPKIAPIASFVQEHIAKGKTAKDLKEMVKAKYAMVDLRDAAEALGVVLSKEGLSENHINSLIKEGKISLILGTELKKIGKKFPVKESPKFAEAVSVERVVGVPGYFHSLDVKKASDNNEGYRKASIEALKKGFDIEAVKAKLLKKLSAEDTDQVLLEAVTMLNALPAGIVANKAKKADRIMVEEPIQKQTLPDPSTIVAQTQEILGTFEGYTMNVDIDPAVDFNSVEINELFNRSGIDETI
jgi:hypothetical protein